MVNFLPSSRVTRLNPFYATGFFLYPLKTSENLGYVDSSYLLGFNFLFCCLHLFHCIKVEFSIQDFSSKLDQISRKLGIWSHLLEKSLMENFIFCAVFYVFPKVLFFLLGIFWGSETGLVKWN